MNCESLSVASKMSPEDIEFFPLHKEGTPRIEGTARASGVASSDMVLGDLVELMPSTLFRMLIAGVSMRLPFPRPSTPSSGIAPADTMHVCILPLFVALSFFGLNII